MSANTIIKPWTVVIHGGAGNISRNFDPHKYKEGLAKSLESAVKVVKKEKLAVCENYSKEGTSLALKAAIEAVVEMEDNPIFNAGRGSCLTSINTIEMEAAVMEGETKEYGACTIVKRTQNPVLLSEVIRTNSQHSYLGFDTADNYAMEHGLTMQDPDYFMTERRKKQLNIAVDKKIIARDHDLLHNVSKNEIKEEQGTVGAVVMDQDGKLAVAISTGGRTNKLPGRIGDSPCVGTGFYANEIAAVAGTGDGEVFLKNCSCAQVCFMMEFGGFTLKEAVRKVIFEDMKKGDGGIIAVSSTGEICMELNTLGMFRAAQNHQGYKEISVWEEVEVVNE